MIVKQNICLQKTKAFKRNNNIKLQVLVHIYLFCFKIELDFGKLYDVGGCQNGVLANKRASYAIRNELPILNSFSLFTLRSLQETFVLSKTDLTLLNLRTQQKLVLILR